MWRLLALAVTLGLMACGGEGSNPERNSPLGDTNDGRPSPDEGADHSLDGVAEQTDADDPADAALDSDVPGTETLPDGGFPDTGDEAAVDVGVADDVAVDSVAVSDVSPADTSVDATEMADLEIPDDTSSDSPFIMATFVCQPTIASCDAPVAPDQIASSYRKDAWLEEYNEYGDPPLNGGRFHIAGRSMVTGRVTRVLINGVDTASIHVENAPGDPAFEWFHYWPANPVAGQPIWVQFHSRDALWDRVGRATIVVETDAGDALRGEFAVQEASVPLTYVTTSADMSTLLVFARNDSRTVRTVEYIHVNGRNVTESACFDPLIEPGDTALFEIPLCEPAVLGAAFTVELGLDDRTNAVGVGRILRPHFPIEGWNNTVECPFPGGIEDNYRAMVDAGFDTQYVHGGLCGTCRCDTRTLVESVLPSSTMRALITSDIGLSGSPMSVLEGIAGWATGDESDGEIYDASTGVPVAAQKAEESQRLWERYPTVATFNGAKTNRHIGTFAGMADVQGIDLYIAACAPHITPWGQHPPITGAYDYLRNTRDNHMPLPTWMYAQGLAPVWNKTVPLLGTTIHVQPDPQEILIQAFAVLAAGGKGLMWFQTNQQEADYRPARWSAIADANRMIGAVRQLVREGDITGDATADAGVLVESIRSRRAIVVPVINHRHTSAPDDVTCLGANVSESSVPHWILADVATDVRVEIARNFGVVDVFEVTANGVVDSIARASGRTLTLPGVTLSNRTPVRLFVIAGDEDLRAEIERSF